MRDFNYFGESAQLESGAVAEEGNPQKTLQQAIFAHRQRERRLQRAVLLLTALLVVLTWFVWSYRDQVAYAFSAPRPPQQLGDVADLSPGDIPHNAYVEVVGITEHRGLAQKLVRGVLPVREELWYFRLLGSRGVFVEVPPDKDRYGFATRLRARGRAVDPERATVYKKLLSEYDERYHPKERRVFRIIQVGVEPGKGRAPFIVVFGILLLVASTNVWVLVRYLERRRKRPLVELRR